MSSENWIYGGMGQGSYLQGSCVWCNTTFRSRDPKEHDAYLKTHIFICFKHPMRSLERKLRKLEKKLSKRD